MSTNEHEGERCELVAVVSAPTHKRSASLLRVSRPRLIANLLTVVVTLVFSYVAFSDLNLALAWRSLRMSDYWWLLLSFGAFCLSDLTRAVRWRSLFARGRRPPVGVVGNAMLVGYLYNNILPARAGEAARIVVLSQRSDAAPVEIVGTVVLERLYDLLAILVIFFMAEPWLPHVSWFGLAAIVAMVLTALVATCAIALAFFGDRPLRVLLRPLGRLAPFSGAHLERTLSDLVHGLSGLRHPGLAVEAFVWTIASWLLTATCAYFVAIAFHLHLPFASGVLVAVAIGLSMILPSPPAAAGVFEGAALIALKAYGIQRSSALPYALVLHLINFVPFVVVGAGLLHHNARHPRSVAEKPRSHDAVAV